MPSHSLTLCVDIHEKFGSMYAYTGMCDASFTFVVEGKKIKYEKFSHQNTFN